MKTRTLHRALSMLLTAAMVLNIGLTPVFATEGTTPPSINGVCTHHTEHKVNGGEADREDPLGGGVQPIVATKRVHPATMSIPRTAIQRS